ncbi:Anp1-domain-containing protein [Halteromyces radiatus]|uniref:Anp1-domain-containing protein n=1 Tax=Halteromyces radiatus TaxID=101107 RepID=UPI002220807D|nr:Anp1-domain-containing protein [Halteromyces radiatus]KAI8088727.1 Anp1-domain-containing protein [Halteromyces radiatus]
MSSVYTFRGGKRLGMVTLLLTCLFLYVFYQGISPHNNNNNLCHNTRSLNSQQVMIWKGHDSLSSPPHYRDLNALNATSDALQNQEHILVLTPLFTKDTAKHLSTYFDLLDRTSYPNHLISIGLLVSSNMDTQEEQEGMMLTLATEIQRLQQRWFHAFHDITVYQRDFHFDFGDQPFKLQPYRRSIMARARNYLLSAALQEHHSWVAWIDVGLVDYPLTIFEDLMAHNKDVIVPNCLVATQDGSFWAYDRNNWQETDGSLRFQRMVGEDFVMLEGFKELATGRTLMVDMPTHLGHDHLVELDGVGTTFTLVKAQVHREGANFPSYPLQHQVDAEGFARMVHAMGYGIYGIPSYLIYHSPA